MMQEAFCHKLDYTRIDLDIFSFLYFNAKIKPICLTTRYLRGLKYAILHLMKVTLAENYKTFCFVKFKLRCVRKEVKSRGRKEEKYVELEPCSSNSCALYREGL